MSYDQRQSTPQEDPTYVSRLELVTGRLDALIDNDEVYSDTVNTLLDDVITFHNGAEKRKRDNVDAALRLLDQAIIVLTLVEERAQVEREAREAAELRQYAALFATVSQWAKRWGRDVLTRAGRRHVNLAKRLIELAICTRHQGEINRAVLHLHGAVTALRKGKTMEETFAPQLKQLWQWYEVVSRGVEPESEADDYLEQFTIAVDVFDDAIAQGDTDYIIEVFDTAVALLKDAAAARPRR